MKNNEEEAKIILQIKNKIRNLHEKYDKGNLEELGKEEQNKDTEKVKRIENLLKQLKFEKKIEIEMNNNTNSMIDGKIVALEIVLAILKDKI